MAEDLEIEAVYEFLHFPRLPPEIRGQIWLHTLPSTPCLIPYPATLTPVIANVNRESRNVFLLIYTKCFILSRRPRFQPRDIGAPEPVHFKYQPRPKPKHLDHKGRPKLYTQEPVLFANPICLYANLSLDILYFDSALVPFFRDTAMYPYQEEWLTTQAVKNIKTVAVSLQYWSEYTWRLSDHEEIKRPLSQDLYQLKGIQKLMFVRENLFEDKYVMERHELIDERIKIRNLDKRELVEVEKFDDCEDDGEEGWEVVYRGCSHVDLWKDETKGPERVFAQIMRTGGMTSLKARS